MAVPILIHLFFRLKTKRVELGTIRFLRVVLEENARRRKVMRWLLLALRMGFVALLVGLFARPYLRAAATTGQKELLVILIDQSATMQLKGERGRLIDQAVAEARKLVESAASGTRVGGAFFDHEVRPVTTVDGGAGRSEPILAQLQVPATTFGATNYGNAIAWARDICVKAPLGRKHVHLLTDLQRSGLDWSEVEPFPADVNSHLHDLGSAVVNNVAVAEIRTPRLWVHPGDTPTLRASIQYNGAVSLNDVPIVLEVGRIDDKTRPAVSGDSQASPAKTADFAKLAERITKRERVKLEPGATVTLNFELPSLSEGLWQGRVTAEYDDDLAFDNQRYFAISATPPYRVLIVNGGESVSSMTSETYFLETALRLAAEGESFQESPFAPTVIPYTEGTVLPNLDNFDAVILANVGGMTREDASRLARHTRLGGGLIVFTGDKTTATSCSALNDVGLGVGTLGAPRVTVDLPWRLSKWDETHPVLLPLSDPQHGDLRRLIFAAYTHVTPSPNSKVLLEFGTGDPAIIESHAGEGKVMWVTISCGRDWSDWSRSRLFLPLVHQLLGYEVGMTEGGRVRTRSVDTVQQSDSANGQEPTKQTATERVSTASNVSTAPLSPGVFQRPRYSEVVNTSPRESDVDRCSREEFENRFAMKFVDESGVAATRTADGGNVEFQRDEIWHWVACALLAVLLLEGFVGNRTTA